MKKARNVAADIINILGRQRPKVRLPPFPKGGWLRSRVGLGAEVEAERAAWWFELNTRVTAAVSELAAATDADPRELLKVARLLVDLVPPEARGRPESDCYGILLLVAVEMSSEKTQEVACELAGVDKDTFRKHRDANPKLWKFLRATVTTDSLRFISLRKPNK